MFTLTGSLLFAMLGVCAQADLPPQPAGFSNPTEITNVHAPFNPGSVGLYNGRHEGRRAVTLVSQLADTRVFGYGDQSVECRIVREQVFVGGKLVEAALNYLAQDDAGAVWMFGEVTVEYADGLIVGPEQDSWLVGGPLQPDDPAGIHAPQEPALLMPAELHVGTSFGVHNYGDPDETITVVSIDARLRVPAGRFTHAVKIKETHLSEAGPPETRWIVPGVGVVKEKAKGSSNQLIATSRNLMQDGAGAD